MPTELQSDTSRANGAKSKGPITAEGREKSSRNSLKHGYTAVDIILLDCDNSSEFQEMQDDYAATYQPASRVEQDLVDEMVISRWRLNRIRAIETVLLNTEVYRRPRQKDPSLSHIELADAFRALADDSNALALALRYQTRLQRLHERCLLILRDVQRERKSQSAVPAPLSVQPEPSAPVPQPDSPQPDSVAPPLAPAANPATETQPPAAATPLHPAACVRNKNFQNEPRVPCAINRFRLRLSPRSIRSTAPQRSAQRISIG
jgi:hypothetical protein